MNTIERMFFAILFVVLFALAIGFCINFIDIADTNNTITNKDMMSKASVMEHTGVEKDSLSIDAKYNAIGEGEYVTVKGADVLYDLINTIDAVSERDIKNGKVSVTIKISTGDLHPTNEELIKIKNRKSTVLESLDAKIDKQKEYKRIYYYNADLRIKQLVYDF